MMANALLRDVDSRIPVISTVFAMFAGLGWTYAIYLELTTTDLSSWSVLSKMWRKTYDMGMSPIFLGPTARAIAFTSMFALIYFLKKHNCLDNRTRLLFFVLPAVAVMNGFLAHIAEVTFFFLILPLLFLVTGSGRNLWHKRLSLSLLLALVVTTVIDCLSPPRYYTYLPSLVPLYVSIVAALTLLITKRYYIHLLLKLKNRVGQHIKILTIALLLLFIYFFGLCFVTWHKLLPTLNSGDFRFMGIQIVPWFLYPMLLGVTGFMAVLSLSYLNDKNMKSYLPFVILAITALLLGRFQRLIPAYMYHEYRIVTNFLAIAASVLAAFTFVKVVSRLQMISYRHVRSYLLVGALILVIVVSGIPSKLYRYERGFMLDFNRTHLSGEEISALNWLRENVNQNDVVLTTTLQSSFTINTLVGIEAIGGTSIGLPYSRIFFDLVDPEPLFFILDQSNIKYVYLASRDNPSVGALTSLLPFFTVEFSNSEVKIYRVPTFHQPSSSDIAFIKPSNPTLFSYLYPLSMVALSDLPYQVFIESDPKQFDNKVIILPSHLIREKHLDWVKDGGTLIVLNRVGGADWRLGGGDYLMDVCMSYTGEVKEANGILFHGNLVSLPKISVPLLNSENGQIEVLGYYSWNSTPVTPFAYLKKLGKGEILCLEMLPYFEAMYQNMGKNSGKKLFSALELLMKNLETNLAVGTGHFQTETTFMDYSYAIRKIALEGMIQLNSSFINFFEYPLRVDELDLSLADAIIDGEECTDVKLNNMEIERIIFEGSIVSEMFASNVEIDPSEGLGSYMPLKITGGFNCILNSSGTKIVLEAKSLDNSRIFNITVIGGTLRLVGVSSMDQSVKLMVRQPDLIIDGNLLADALNKPNSNIWNLLSRAWKIKGELTVSYSSDNVMVLSRNDFTFTAIEKPDIYQLRYDEWNIPWLTIFLSKTHIFLMLIISGCIFFRGVSTKKSRKRGIKSG